MIDINELALNTTQVEQFAFNIYKDIEKYLQENEEEYFYWTIKNCIGNLSNYVLTLNGIIKVDKSRYEYKLCNYAV